MRIESGSNDAPNGGNVTVVHCYIHDNQDGILGNNAGPGVGSWYSPNPYITLRYDDFYHNGAGNGSTHNIYIGFGGNMRFTLEYSSSRDAVMGHLVKTRAPFNYIR